MLKSRLLKFSQFALVSLAFCYASNALAKIELSGEFSQGGLILGKTASGSKVELNDKPLKLSQDGQFVFAFSRDDQTNYLLVATAPDGTVTKKQFKPAKREYKIDRVEGIAKKIMSPNVKNQQRAAKDSKQVKQARAKVSDLPYFNQGFIAPRQSKITGVYGSQRFYNGKPKNPHYGVDYRGAVGAPVYAPAGGVVTLWVPDMFYSGGTLIIDHGFGLNSTFLHLSASYVEVGQQVKQGDKIAAVGKSGRANGPHLDWRMNWFDVRLDPQLAIKATPFKKAAL